ncbi:MAG: tRNA (guanosine(46)-N7)-methyltransferase TrmB [Chitinophagaceae bacterium]|nr:tRNA (guanosine(46)-N7)-methyltransferase TrmB [Chitinophagaceae bacterium]
MGQKKLIRFAELLTFTNVLQYPQGMKGNWHKQFGNNNPITLELACGKGEYTVGLSQIYTNRNFIGVDVKGNRIWVGAKKAIQQGLNNAAFLRTQIDKIHEYFEPGEVQEIWLTFPDPQLRTSRAKKRLTHPKFLELYQHFLIPNGTIHLKTDSPVLYNFTKLVLELHNLKAEIDLDNVHQTVHNITELEIKTHYEGLDIAQSNRIHYLRFRLPQVKLENKDDILHELLKEIERT